MYLTIWRHGEAAAGAPDNLRALTERGRDELHLGCRTFSEACDSSDIVYPDKIFYSPLVRTTQTAEIIAEAFAGASAIAAKALRPESNVALVDAAVSGAMQADTSSAHIVLVSHQPLVSTLVDSYLGAPGRVPFLTPGGRVTLSIDTIAPACGTLSFWACPPTYAVGR